MTKMAAVARELQDALDNLPLHTKQLAEMFRKHGTKHGRDGDELMQLDIDLAKKVDGWKPDGPTPNEIVDAGHKHRPRPEDYLDQDYIDAHLERFAEGASRIYVKANLGKYGPAQADGTTFVFPTEELNRILVESKGDARALATMLGMDENYYLEDGVPVEVEIRHFTPDELNGLDIPSGNEGGANPQWIPGGYLPTGSPEAVISMPDGFDRNDPSTWPGSSAPLVLN